MPNLVTSTGVSLDPTSAVASDIFKDKTAYDGEGNRIVGTYTFPSVNVTAGNMLSGTSAINSSGTVVNGSMVNRGSNAATLSVGGSKTYSAGYYSGGTVTVNSLPSITASASDIRSGKTALNSSGQVITGTLAGFSGSGIFAAFGSTSGYNISGCLIADGNFVRNAGTGGCTFTRACTVRVVGYGTIPQYCSFSITCAGQTLVSISSGSSANSGSCDRNIAVSSGSGLSISMGWSNYGGWWRCGVVLV